VDDLRYYLVLDKEGIRLSALLAFTDNRLAMVELFRDPLYRMGATFAKESEHGFRVIS